MRVNQTSRTKSKRTLTPDIDSSDCVVASLATPAQKVLHSSHLPFSHLPAAHWLLGSSHMHISLAPSVASPNLAIEASLAHCMDWLGATSLPRCGYSLSAAAEQRRRRADPQIRLDITYMGRPPMSSSLGLHRDFASPVQFTSAFGFLVMRPVFLVALFSLLHCGNGWPVAIASTQLLVGRTEHSYPNSTANGTAVDADPSWVAAPKVRGTWQLIVGCLTTLSLCAWTAYHPNVCQESGMVKKLWRRFTWMMAAVVGPEAVLYCAWEQRWMANRLRKKVNRLGRRAVDGFEPPPPRKEDEYVLTRCSSAPTFSSQSSTLHDDRCSIYSSRSDVVAPQPSKEADHDAQSPFMRFSFEEPAIEKPHHDGFSQRPSQDKASPLFTSWTLQQAFFAVCGGLAVSTGSFWHSPTMTLTPRGVLELTRAGLLPSVTDDEVTEKSKANTAAKVMVCIQASWFLVQAVARLAQKLPLTLLEVHVLAHVLCALAMYFCWVDKPYDAETPIVIADEKVKDMIALFVLDAAPRTGSTSDEVSVLSCARLLSYPSVFDVSPCQAHCTKLWRALENVVSMQDCFGESRKKKNQMESWK
ncbi:hypothetical protein BKA80DRAFT_31849 [Phyllosticta citrichinensis]